MDPKTLPSPLQILLHKHQLALEPHQPHIGGERALLSPGKLVLMARTADNLPVVAKYSISPQGAAEIQQEAKVRRLFENLPFSEQRFLLPKILLHDTFQHDDFLVSEFIGQPCVLQDYTLAQQFFMSIHALENQETFHTTTNEHGLYVQDHFQILSTTSYQKTLHQMIVAIIAMRPDFAELLTGVQEAFTANQHILNTFSGYLVHADFVPHNFRIVHNQFYLLDYVSFKIANKYESWARYINFMELHQPALAQLLVTYLERDRNQHELVSLWLMRLYRAVFLIHYYCSIYEKTTDDLQILTAARIEFWSEMLKAIYNRKTIPEALVANYCAIRDSLRTETEKERQRTFTKAD